VNPAVLSDLVDRGCDFQSAVTRDVQRLVEVVDEPMVVTGTMLDLERVFPPLVQQGRTTTVRFAHVD
jgi:hypothetical protein